MADETAQDLIDTDAHHRASDRLVASRGSIYRAFDELDCGITHEQVMGYLWGSPSFASLHVDLQGKVAGMIMGFALTVVESDREVNGSG